DDPARVLAGSPRVGLLADAAASLPDQMLTPDGQRSAPDTADDKQLFRAAAPPPRSARLAAVVVLQDFADGPPALTALAGPAALAALRANSYGDWINAPQDASARHWLALMAAVPVHALVRPRDLTRIAACCALIDAL
ncbi:MAG: hypothetical protein RLZZ58_765, partial [Pseudomonadota bacterium]